MQNFDASHAKIRVTTTGARVRVINREFAVDSAIIPLNHNGL